jgi:glutamate racemase
MSSLPIGIFDSGVGGLTVLAAIRRRLPRESVLYLGDTARVPYGAKSRVTIERYALEDASFLVAKGVKMLVVACNTASAMARGRLRESFDLPILSVIGPGARAAVRATSKRRIGVIATEATIESGAYVEAIRNAAGDQAIEIFPASCPLFVALAEEGETDSEVARLVAEKYLAPLREKEIDTLLLGCTHYPLLREVIAATIGPHVALVDSAEATAEEVASLLGSSQLLDANGTGEQRFFVTDAARRFHRIAERILGGPLPHLEAVELTSYDRFPARA